MKKPQPTRSPKRSGKLSEFAQRLFAEWQTLHLPQHNATVVVAVSGGADSTALLLALDELKRSGKLSVQLVVAHLDHGLRKASAEDAEWVEQLCAKLGVTVVVHSANIRKRAKDTADNLEQVARNARYDFFRRTSVEHHAQVVLTAHTLDDQAETILMRLVRGSAAEGLAGMDTVRALSSDSKVLLARPFLSWARRNETEHYCRTKRVRFRVDEMNSDERFVRVRVRKQLLPLMQSFNNRIVEALSRTAILLREDARALSEEAEKLLQEAAANGDKAEQGSRLRVTLKTKVLESAPPSIRKRALRLWISREVGHLKRVEMVHLNAVEKLLDGNRGRRVELPGGVEVWRKRGRLQLSVKKVEKAHRDL
jgi:tRNA(Ile)-lysidine synthase